MLAIIEIVLYRYLMAKDEKNYKAIAESYEKKEADAHRAQAIHAKSRAENWLDLASHFQAKVQKRTSEVAFLQTKAGFLIAAAVIILQIISGLPKFDNPVEFVFLCLAVVLTFASLITTIVSMHMNATNALNPQKMITDLSSKKHSDMSREQFGRWLAASYAKTNDRFNKEYSNKYKQQLWASCLLVIAFAIIIILKGVKTYV